MIEFFKGIGKKVDSIAVIIGRLIVYPLFALLVLLLFKAIISGFNPSQPVVDITTSIISLIRYYFEVIAGIIPNILAIWA